MKRIVNFFAPDTFDPATEIICKKEKPVAQRATSFFTKIFQRLAGTYSVLSQMSDETENFLEAEEYKYRRWQKERSETQFAPKTQTTQFDLRLKVPEHFLAGRVQNL